MEREWVRGEAIGRGAFGEVSLAYDKCDGRVFAVKSAPLNSGNSVAALDNEIDILRGVESGCVVSYLGSSVTGEWRNLHMEYVPGGTVADVAGRIGEREIRAYTRRVAEALFYLHSVAGVVHSDVKGRNVLAGPAPELAKLADFGSSRRISDNKSQKIGGTPLWMAPEVMRGEPATPAADIWSLGCTVIEMATGAHPWKSSACGENLVRIGYGDELPEIPSQLLKQGRDFVSKCLRRDPAERWTAKQLLQHPFLAGAVTPTGSPRSVLDWASAGFEDKEDNSDDEGEEDPTDAAVSGRERIRDLAARTAGVARDWDWGSEGWETVRDLGIDDRCRNELGSGATSYGSSPRSCSGSDFGYDQRQVGSVAKSENPQNEKQRLEKQRESFHIEKGANANPIVFSLVLQLCELYSDVRRGLLLRYVNN